MINEQVDRKDKNCLLKYTEDDILLKLRLENKPTAVFAEDLIAIGAIRAIREAGFSVPEDFSIIGFDSIEIGRHYHLTTIAQDQIGLGEAASKLLLNIINQKSFSPIILPTKLIEGETCRKL